MKCLEAEKSILLQDSRELGDAKTRDLVQHLSGCEACRHFKNAVIESANSFSIQYEPPLKVVQDVMRTARINAPTKRKRMPILVLKPAFAMVAAVVIGLGLFFSNTKPAENRDMVLVVTDTQLLEPEDQVVSIIYDGLSEDDLAFNFLMTYEDDA